VLVCLIDHNNPFVGVAAINLTPPKEFIKITFLMLPLYPWPPLITPQRLVIVINNQNRKHHFIILFRHHPNSIYFIFYYPLIVWLCVLMMGLGRLLPKKTRGRRQPQFIQNIHLIIIHKNIPEQPKQSNLNSINAKMKLCSMVLGCQL